MATSLNFNFWYTVTGGNLTAVSSTGTFTLTDITGGPDGSTATSNAGEISVSTAVGSTPTPALDRIVSYNTTSNGDVLVSNGTVQYLLSNVNTHAVNNTVTAASLTPISPTPATAYTYCFLTGTQIATPHGAVAVETLQVGDEVITHSGATAKVRFNFIQQKRNHIFADKETLFPICIQANALADNVPSRDLYVTADHAIYFPEWNFFVEASILAVIVNDTSIYPVQQMPETFTYYHILCDNQEIVLAENTPAETFIDNVSMETFDNYAEYAALYPEEHVMEEIDIPRGRSERPLPRAFKQNLLERAQRLYPVAQAA